VASTEVFERLTKALNERGYLVIQSTIPFVPGEVVKDCCDSHSLPLGHPLVIIQETDIRDFIEHVKALGSHDEDVAEWRGRAGYRYYYRVSTD
jgi:hypothetical protein